MDDAISYSLDGDIATISLDDGKANALSPAVVAGVATALARAESEARAAVLHGRPGRFSAGFDLSVMTAGVEPMRALVSDGAGLLLRLFTSPLPIVVACTGHALAAGALVLLAGDRRIGAEGDFKIGLNEVAIGMVLPLFAIELAAYRLAPTHLDAATAHATVYDPQGALTAGYLDRVVSPDALLDEAAAEATRLAALRSGAFAETKARLHEATATRIRATLGADMAGLASPG